MVDTELPPREERQSVFLTAVVRRFNSAAPSKHRIRNLSSRGACIDGAGTFRKGETVVIDVGMIAELGATIRWVQDGLAGLKFAHPIEAIAAKSRPKPEHVAGGWNGLMFKSSAR